MLAYRDACKAHRVHPLAIISTLRTDVIQASTFVTARLLPPDMMPATIERLRGQVNIDKHQLPVCSLDLLLQLIQSPSIQYGHVLLDFNSVIITGNMHHSGVQILYSHPLVVNHMEMIKYHNPHRAEAKDNLL